MEIITTPMIVLFAVLAVIFVLMVVMFVGIMSNLKQIWIQNTTIGDKLCEINDSFENVVSGSKRMERNIDAINQRTRAHLVTKRDQKRDISQSKLPHNKHQNVKKGTGYGSKKYNNQSRYSNNNSSNS